jgi:lysophospholipase L1-like esterase
MKWTAIPLLLALAAPLAAPVSAEPPKFQPVDGDRIVFLGGTLVERDQSFGYFEALLTRRFKDVNFTFRNLGWSGDTVYGDARAGFGTQKEGYASLLFHVNELKPTILLVNYGFNESFDGEAGLQHFGYNALLADLEKTHAKIWLISPQRHEDLGRPLPDPTKHNEQLKLYTDAVGKIAGHHDCGFIDLFERTRDGTKENPPRPLTDNGIHFTDYGARRIGWTLLTALTDLTPSVAPDQLAGEGSERFQELRATINKKNREFFYRWRPQNETYIFGFRKHEQGKNAIEIPQFDPIIEKLEEKINELKK